MLGFCFQRRSRREQFLFIKLAGQNICKNNLKIENSRIGEAPFDSQRKMMSTVHSTNNGIYQYTKGAPDEVLKNCTHVYKDGKVVEISWTEEQ